MKKLISSQVFKSVLFIIASSISGYSADATYNNLTVYNYFTTYGKAGIGGGIDQNHALTVSSAIYDVGPGKGPLFVFRAGSPNSWDGGSSWALSQSDAAIRGFSYWGNPYSAVMAAYSSLDYNNSTALIAADNNATISAKLAYKDGTGILWPGYFSTSGANALQYGMALRNPNSTDGGGTATGILFSTETAAEDGKGAIVYERKKSWARGSIHFLQEPNGNFNNPGLSNIVMTITNEGNVGIGMQPSPFATHKLEVNGKIKVDDNINLNGHYLSNDGSNSGISFSSGGVIVGPGNLYTNSIMFPGSSNGISLSPNGISIGPTLYANNITSYGAV